ncbi:MAG: glycosyltransferase family 39 protein [Planctomycetota bacterium]
MSRRTKLAAFLLVLAAAAALRCGYVFELRATSPFFEVPVVDAEEYDDWAHEVAVEGRFLGDTVRHHAPLYPWILGLVYAATGGSRLAARLVQVALGLGTLALVFAAARRSASDRGALVAAGLGAVYWPLVYFEGELLTATLETFLAAAVLLSFVRAWEAPTLARAGMIGFLLGLSAITRLNGLALAPLAVIVLAARARAKAAVVLATLAFMVLPILPVALWNLHVSGELIPIQSRAGLNLFIGNNPESDGTAYARPGRDYVRLLDLPFREGGATTPASIEAFYMRRVLDFATQQPLEFLALAGRKTLLLFNHREIKESQHPELEAAGTVLGRWPLPGMALLLPLAVIGVVMRVQRRRLPWPVLIVWAGFAISNVVAYAGSRYRLPTIPALLVLAGAGVGSLESFYRGREFRPMATAALIAVGTAALTLLPLVPITDADRGERHYLIAYAARKSGDIKAARHHAELAAHLRPSHPDTHYNLGVIVELEGAPGWEEAAARHYRDAIALDTTFPQARENLASLLHRTGATEAAVLELETCLREYPGRGETWLYLGFIHGDRARRTRAAADVEQALRCFFNAAQRLRPATRALLEAGRLLREVGDLDAAALRLEEALETDPRSAEAVFELGLTRRAQGEEGRAREAFRQALERDPRFAPARHALEQPRDPGPSRIQEPESR